MSMKKLGSSSLKVFSGLFCSQMLLFLLLPLHTAPARAQAETATPTGTPVTAQGIIDSFNAIRRRHNMRALIVDPILAGLAQQTADTMAIGEMSGHIGGVRERAIAAGYGAGDIPWLTENFAIGPMSLEELMQTWSDDDHMRPANNVYYAHCGVGIAEYNGDVYYIFIAGYTSNGIYKPGATALPGQTLTAPISQVMFPVTKATPGADGRIIHEVKHGQTLWAIAIAYGTHIVDIQHANDIPTDQLDLYEGEKLVIPVSAVSLTAGPAMTDTPAAASAEKTEIATATALPPQPTSTPTSESAPGISGEFIIVLAAVLVAIGLIGFGLFASRRNED